MKNRKILYILTVVIVVIVVLVSSFTVSALTTYNFVSSRPQINNNSCYFEIVTQSGAAYLFYVSIALQSTGMQEYLDTDRYSVNFETKFENGNLWVFPSDISSLSDVSEIHFEYYEIYGVIFNQDGSTWSPTIIWDDNINEDGYSVGIFIGEYFSCVRAYNADFTFNSGNSIIFAYGNEINTNNKLDQIIAGIQGGNQDIINNQNENADKVIQNQEDNTNKIINGGSDNPHYSENDKTAVNEYSSEEAKVNSATFEARSSTISLFNNFAGLLNDGSLHRGLLAVSKIMTEIFAIDWVGSLVQFALVIGAFSFIIGSVIMVVGRLSSNERNKSRSEFYNSRRKK